MDVNPTLVQTPPVWVECFLSVGGCFSYSYTTVRV